MFLAFKYEIKIDKPKTDIQSHRLTITFSLIGTWHVIKVRRRIGPEPNLNSTLSKSKYAHSSNTTNTLVYNT